MRGFASVDERDCWRWRESWLPDVKRHNSFRNNEPHLDYSYNAPQSLAMASMIGCMLSCVEPGYVTSPSKSEIFSNCAATASGVKFSFEKNTPAVR